MATARNELFKHHVNEVLYKRVRIFVRTIYKNETASYELSRYMYKIKGVVSSKANPVTGKILVIFDENIINEYIINTEILKFVENKPRSEHPNVTPFRRQRFEEEIAEPISIEHLHPYQHEEVNEDKPSFHLIEKTKLENLLNTNYISGLSERLAHDKISELGLNVLSEKRRKSILNILLEHLKHLPTKLLIGVGIASALLGQIPDAIAIFGIVAIQTTLETTQQYKAEKSLYSLKDMVVNKAKLIRSGKEQVIESKYLVPGDIVLLEAGDKIPADCRIIECKDLSTTEASLTGESYPVPKSIDVCSKNTELGNRHNMLYMGTNVISGKCKAVVVSTGMNTEIGKIAFMLQSIEIEPTPLENKIGKFTKKMIRAALGLSVVVAGIGLLSGMTFPQILMSSISFALGAMPEGLPAVVSVSIALSVQRMASKNAIVRKLPAVETLGSADVICCDKTGTLTMNEMTVRRIYVDKSFYDATGVGYKPNGEIALSEGTPSSKSALYELLKAGILCNNACLVKSNEHWSAQGDPTEAALITSAYKHGMNVDELQQSYKRINEIPFDSSRRFMTVVVKANENQFAYCKGSFGKIADKCSTILENGEERLFTASDKEKLRKICDEMGERALRVLAFAYKKVNTSSKNIDTNYVFLGIVGMEDPPREGVKEAIQKCHKAGIKVVMITGDNKETASAIGHELGLLTNGLSVSGSELDNMSDDELQNKIDTIQIFARTSPEQKLRIVKAFKKAGHIVAMTGDGVNDAPAIKAANIGIAMGKGGSDVAKDAACITLLDDNFSTIVAAIEEGRTVTKNIRNSIKYLVAGNIGEIIGIFLSTALFGVSPLMSVQILWINVISETIMGLSLAVEPPSKDVMNCPPDLRTETILDDSLKIEITKRSIGIGLSTFGVFGGAMLLGLGVNKARTLAFTSFIFSQLANVYDCRSNKNLAANKYMNIASASSVALLMSILYLPFLNSYFGTMPLRPLELAAAYGTTRLTRF